MSEAVTMGKLREALRKVVLWAECCSAKLSPQDRLQLNWTALNEARAILKNETPDESLTALDEAIAAVQR